MAKKEYNPASGEEEVVTKQKKSRTGGYFDYSLLFVWIFIMLLGYVLLYSASSYSALNQRGDSAYFLKNQIFSTIIGLVPMLIVTFVDYRFWKKLSKFIYGAAVATIFLVRTPLGVEANGARRWVNLKVIQFQPAEAVKIAIIIMTAYMLSKCKSTALKHGKMCWQIYSITIVAGILLFVLTSNLSSALIVFGIGAIMFSDLGFRFSRIAVWRNPEEFVDGTGYQVMQGLYAIGSGGLFGKGLGNSAQKLGFVPEATNDMIFSIICEELGIFGAVCIIALFVFMIRRMRIIASNAPDLFGSMLVIGVMTHISLQVVLNIAVVTNFIPNTGVSLPFISYGGTSLLFLMVEMGLVLSVSRRIKKIH